MTTAVDRAMVRVPLLSVRGLGRSFPGLRALRDVDLDVHAGEVVALVGQNGSGKSTLVKLLTGIHEPDPGGTVTVRHADGVVATGAAARAAVHVIHQDLGLVGSLTTVENLNLGRRDGRRMLLPHRDRAERRRADELVARFGGEFDVGARVETLTPAERTVIAIARALDRWPRPDQILLLDEPTASLNADEAARLFAAVRRVTAGGAGVVFISHRLDEVLDVADRVVALRGGRVVADVAARDLDRSALVGLITGRTLAAVPDRAPGSGEVVLAARALAGPGVRGVDLDLRAGEVLGACGLLGSGREHVAGLVFGAQPRTGGTVHVGGRALPAAAPHVSVARGIGFVPADRRADGAILTMRARENLTLPDLRPLRRAGGRLDGRAERRDAAAWVQRVELDPPRPEQELELFSGGNQQKVVLARWLRTEPAVLLLDEPTQGVDVGAKAAVYRLVLDAAAAGAAVLVTSSDAAELAALCDRVLVFRAGRVATVLDRAELSEAALVEAAQGRTEHDDDPAGGFR